ncbi:GNAT family N-acetyltransferase [Clostridium aminobutyricum]|uniref:GNAT family N-acetyltransferase n=1 Tax=Clostridium aminobutyricum TaxID=33953 RepID=A0A939D760_CLOAM|nr:GNAT family N-acetyltransferase [Clostridium aminobutyricum]MBN7772342.1 GNAT family N-acetyltransferase [Clostridium aminobutyricum]
MQGKKRQTYKFIFSGQTKKEVIFSKELLHLADESDKEELEQIGFFEAREVDLYLQNASIYILRIDGKYVGLGTLIYPYWRKDIPAQNFQDIGMHVAEEYRGKGFGRSIVQHMVSICLENGKIPIAECLIDNAASKATLESAGFIKH